MGWQESRVSLIPKLSESKIESTSSAPAVVSFQNTDEDGSLVVTVQDWLTKKGFQLSEDVGRNSIILENQDIELTLHKIENKLSEITATFTLSKETQFRLGEWERIIVDLCEEFDLVLFDAESMMKRSPDSLANVLSKTSSWQELRVPYSLPQLPPA